MSYCGQPGNESPFISHNWISKLTYKYIWQTLTERTSFLPISITNNISKDYLIIRGFIDGESNVVNFFPFTTITSSDNLTLESGDYSIRLFDLNSNLLEEINFEPNGFSETNVLSFQIPILKNINFHEIRILKGNEEIGSIIKSSNPPIVQLITPNGGEKLNVDSLNIEWQASDADGDSLSYNVQFSKDGGNTWQTIAIDWKEKSYSHDLDDIEETNQGLIRVIASDGISTASDVSDAVFTTPNNEPFLQITSPADGQEFVGSQFVFFEGFGLDKEDGLLEDKDMIWTSDIDGNLGSNNHLEVNASILSEGTHIITLTGTDSKGMTISESISIIIGHSSDCDGTTLRLDGASIDSRIHRAINTISASGIITGGTKVEMRAGESITLTNGFTAESNSTFLAKIESCTNIDNQQEAIKSNTIVLPKQWIKRTEERNLKIYPNPTNGKIYIENRFNEAYNIVIFDSVGRLIQEFELSNNYKEVDISSYLAGIYIIVSIDDLGKTFTKKIVKY